MCVWVCVWVSVHARACVCAWLQGLTLVFPVTPCPAANEPCTCVSLPTVPHRDELWAGLWGRGPWGHADAQTAHAWKGKRTSLFKPGVCPSFPLNVFWIYLSVIHAAETKTQKDNDRRCPSWSLIFRRNSCVYLLGCLCWCGAYWCIRGLFVSVWATKRTNRYMHDYLYC